MRAYMRQTRLLFSFPYVCPEPVLVKRSFLYINGAKRHGCRTLSRAARLHLQTRVDIESTTTCSFRPKQTESPDSLLTQNKLGDGDRAQRWHTYERAPFSQLDQAVDAVVHRRVTHHQRLHLFLRQEVQGCACQRIAVLNRLDARVRAGPETKTTFLSVFPYVFPEPVLVK